MRINKFIAQNSHLSRRQADAAILAARVTLNKRPAQLGDDVNAGDLVTLDNAPLLFEDRKPVTILLNKPVGYICSRDGQGSATVYDLIPKKYENLNIAGRLDKESSGLVLLTSDGDLLYQLTHPSKHKQKLYEVELDRNLTDDDLKKLEDGIDIGDQRPSRFKSIKKISDKTYQIVLEEGRNRQIRRTLTSIGINVVRLNRQQLGEYTLEALAEKEYTLIS